jgi:PAS domain S-box-containing protein
VSNHLVETYTENLDDVIGKTDYDLVDLGATNYDDAEQAHADDRRVLETGEAVIDKEEYNQELDRYFLTSKVPWRNDAGDIVGLIGVSRDITARKRYNEQLQEYRRRLEGAMFAADLAWWEMDIETGEVLFHEKKADLLGYSVADFDTYEDFVALVHPEDTERVMQAMRDHLDGDAPMYDTEYRIQTAAGEYKWFHDMGGVTTTDQDGRPVKVTGIVIDVTEKKRDEERIRRQKEELAVLNRLIRHDIHNYLAIISGWTDLLVEDVSEDLRPTAERVARTTAHAIDLTDEVSELIQALEGDPSLESLSLRDVLSESVSRARDTHPHAEFAVLDNLTSARVQANAMLSSVFDNLFSNAVHHNDKATPRIEVACTDRGDSVVVHVVDNGPGISGAERDDLFEHGVKGESSGGTGLGLFLVKTLVEAYGGAMWVSDNEPEGTAFHVTLRKADSE